MIRRSQHKLSLTTGKSLISLNVETSSSSNRRSEEITEGVPDFFRIKEMKRVIQKGRPKNHKRVRRDLGRGLRGVEGEEGYYGLFLGKPLGVRLGSQKPLN